MPTRTLAPAVAVPVRVGVLSLVKGLLVMVGALGAIVSISSVAVAVPPLVLPLLPLTVCAVME